MPVEIWRVGQRKVLVAGNDQCAAELIALLVVRRQVQIEPREVGKARGEDCAARRVVVRDGVFGVDGVLDSKLAGGFNPCRLAVNSARGQYPPRMAEHPFFPQRITAVGAGLQCVYRRAVAEDDDGRKQPIAERG